MYEKVRFFLVFRQKTCWKKLDTHFSAFTSDKNMAKNCVCITKFDEACYAGIQQLFFLFIREKGKRWMKKKRRIIIIILREQRKCKGLFAVLCRFFFFFLSWNKSLNTRTSKCIYVSSECARSGFIYMVVGPLWFIAAKVHSSA